MADIRPTVFCDGILDAQVAHAVARISLAVTGSDNTPVPCATLCVPITQLPALVRGMTNLLRQIEERVRAQAQAPQGQPPGAQEPAGPAAADAQGVRPFRFQG